MASRLGKVVLVSLESDKDPASSRRQRLVAFLPMTIAVLGAIVVVISGLSSQATQVANRPDLDPMITGSVSPDP